MIKATLLCLPHAGGLALSFRSLRDRLKAYGIEALPIEYPGHGTRGREGLVEDVHQLVAQLAAETSASLDRPFAVFGHSYGALVGFELLRELERRGRQAMCFFPSSFAVPGDPPPSLTVDQSSGDDDFLEQIASWGGLPAEVRMHPDLVEFLMPVLRHDIRSASQYRSVPGTRLSCPIFAMAGASEAEDLISRLGRWREFTHSDVAVQLFEGAHFYLTQDPDRIAEFVAHCLQAYWAGTNYERRIRIHHESGPDEGRPQDQGPLCRA